MSDKAKDDVHWVNKGEAARELEVSLSTLDRMIRQGEVEVQKGGFLTVGWNLLTCDSR